MNKKISKTELIDIVYNSLPNIQLKQVDLIVNSFLDSLSLQLISGKNVEMRGFGSFEVVSSMARKNQKDKALGELTYRVKFKPGKRLKEEVKNIKKDIYEE